jgi:DNA-binding CsgD family transcriptional regulator
METLEIDDLHNLNQSIQKLYTFSNLDTFGVNALSIVDRLVASDLPTFHLTDLRAHQISSTFLPNYAGYPPEIERVIHQHFGEHPIAQQMPRTLNGVHKISDFISQKELHGLEGLYQQFLRSIGMEDQMVFFLPNINSVNWGKFSQLDTSLVGFSMHRPERNFTERDRLVLNLLRPHLAQAYSNAQLYRQSQQDLSQMQQSLNHLGVIILDSQGRVRSIAPQAIIWLETYFVKPTSSTQLPDHLWSWVKHQVSCFANHKDLDPACLPLRIQQAGRELTIRLVVERPDRRYLLLLEEQTLSSLNSLALLGLSQRETEVLALVIQGKDNKTIASQLSVSPTTIRKHLEHIYSKWEVKSRTEAIAQALEKLGFF